MIIKYKPDSKYYLISIIKKEDYYKKANYLVNLLTLLNININYIEQSYAEELEFPLYLCLNEDINPKDYPMIKFQSCKRGSTFYVNVDI